MAHPAHIAAQVGCAAPVHQAGRKAPARAHQRYRFVESDGHTRPNLSAPNSALHGPRELISPQYAHARARETDCLTTPKGCLRVLTARLMRLARNGDVEG